MMKGLLEDPQAWSAIAGDYDQSVRRLLTPFSVRAIEWLDIGADDEVLDVASGPGTTTILAAARAKRVQALDFAPEMIATLRRHAAELDNVEALVGDGQALDFSNGEFTAAFSMFGLMFFPDPAAGLRELHRVLRPGGRVAISSWVPVAQSPMMGPMMAALAHALPPRPDQPPPEPFAFDSPESLARGLEEAGFESVEVETYAPEHAISSAEAYWRDHEGNIIINHLKGKMGDAWAAIDAKILEHLEGSLVGVDSLAMPGLIAKGRRP